MDMNHDSSSMSQSDQMSMSMTMMKQYFHSNTGDHLWFSGFQPNSSASTLGACILLIGIAILTRFLDAFQRTLTIQWSQETILKQSSLNIQQQRATANAPFIFKNDISRGLLYGLHAGLGYLLMLAVMTFNCWFYISILIGLIIGEASFGRFARQQSKKIIQSDPTTPIEISKRNFRKQEIDPDAHHLLENVIVSEKSHDH